MARDPMARADDPHPGHSGHPYVVVGSFVYYVQPKAEHDLPAAWRAGNSAAGHMFVLTSFDRPVATLGPPDLEAVVANACLLLFSAYDGDSVLVLDRG